MFPLRTYCLSWDVCSHYVHIAKVGMPVPSTQHISLKHGGLPLYAVFKHISQKHGSQPLYAVFKHISLKQGSQPLYAIFK